MVQKLRNFLNHNFKSLSGNMKRSLDAHIDTPGVRSNLRSKGEELLNQYRKRRDSKDFLFEQENLPVITSDHKLENKIQHMQNQIDYLSNCDIRQHLKSIENVLADVAQSEYNEAIDCVNELNHYISDPQLLQPVRRKVQNLLSLLVQQKKFMDNWKMQECEVEGENLQLFTDRIQEMQLKISDLTRNHDQQLMKQKSDNEKIMEAKVDEIEEKLYTIIEDQRKKMDHEMLDIQLVEQQLSQLKEAHEKENTILCSNFEDQVRAKNQEICDLQQQLTQVNEKHKREAANICSNFEDRVNAKHQEIENHEKENTILCSNFEDQIRAKNLEIRDLQHQLTQVNETHRREAANVCSKFEDQINAKHQEIVDLQHQLVSKDEEFEVMMKNESQNDINNLEQYWQQQLIEVKEQFEHARADFSAKYVDMEHQYEQKVGTMERELVDKNVQMEHITHQLTELRSCHKTSEHQWKQEYVELKQALEETLDQIQVQKQENYALVNNAAQYQQVIHDMIPLLFSPEELVDIPEPKTEYFLHSPQLLLISLQHLRTTCSSTTAAVAAAAANFNSNLNSHTSAGVTLEGDVSALIEEIRSNNNAWQSKLDAHTAEISRKIEDSRVVKHQLIKEESAVVSSTTQTTAAGYEEKLKISQRRIHELEQHIHVLKQDLHLASTKKLIQDPQLVAQLRVSKTSEQRLRQNNLTLTNDVKNLKLQLKTNIHGSSDVSASSVSSAKYQRIKYEWQQLKSHCREFKSSLEKLCDASLDDPKEPKTGKNNHHVDFGQLLDMVGREFQILRQRSMHVDQQHHRREAEWSQWKVQQYTFEHEIEEQLECLSTTDEERQSDMTRDKKHHIMNLLEGVKTKVDGLEHQEHQWQRTGFSTIKAYLEVMVDHVDPQVLAPLIQLDAAKNLSCRLYQELIQTALHHILNVMIENELKVGSLEIDCRYAKASASAKSTVAMNVLPENNTSIIHPHFAFVEKDKKMRKIIEKVQRRDAIIENLNDHMGQLIHMNVTYKNQLEMYQHHYPGLRDMNNNQYQVRHSHPHEPEYVVSAK